MGRYTDRMGERLAARGRANTVRVVFRLVLIVAAIAVSIWVFRLLRGGML